MGCFTADFFENLLIWLVIIIVIVGIIKLLIPYLAGIFGGPPGGEIVLKILSYVLWGIIVIFIIVLAFDLFSCLRGDGIGSHSIFLR